MYGFNIETPYFRQKLPRYKITRNIFFIFEMLATEIVRYYSHIILLNSISVSIYWLRDCPVIISFVTNFTLHFIHHRISATFVCLAKSQVVYALESVDISQWLSHGSLGSSWDGTLNTFHWDQLQRMRSGGNTP